MHFAAWPDPWRAAVVRPSSASRERRRSQAGPHSRDCVRRAQPPYDLGRAGTHIASERQPSAESPWIESGRPKMGSVAPMLSNPKRGV